MTFDQIKQLIDIVCEKGLHELEVERSDFRVRITAGGSGGARPAPVPAGAAATVAAVSPAAAPFDTMPAAPATAAGHTITSPIVGTFYRSASPESEPYVQVGDRVQAGQVLCIVEAMKLMNEIESDVSGEVLEVLPSNEQPVEFGEPLFVLRSDS